MIDRFIGWFAPHICEGCGAVGSALCDSCNFNILKEKYMICIDCGQRVANDFHKDHRNVCHTCFPKLPFDHVSVVGKRDGVLKKLVGNFKYFSHRSASDSISNLICGVLPIDIPIGTAIIYVPTAPKHIRARGFDHMKLVANNLATKKKIPALSALRRLDNKSQHSANLATRRNQAKTSFAIKNNYKNKLPETVILVDDIYTTGSTVKAIAKILKQNGTKKVWLAIVARN